MKRNKKKQLHCDEYLVASLFSSNKTFHFGSNESSYTFSRACKCIERVICKNVYLEYMNCSVGFMQSQVRWY